MGFLVLAQVSKELAYSFTPTGSVLDHTRLVSSYAMSFKRATTSVSISTYITNKPFPFTLYNLFICYRLDYIINSICFILVELPRTSISLEMYSTKFSHKFFFYANFSIVVALYFIFCEYFLQTNLDHYL